MGANSRDPIKCSVYFQLRKLPCEGRRCLEPPCEDFGSLLISAYVLWLLTEEKFPARSPPGMFKKVNAIDVLDAQGKLGGSNI